MSQSGTGWQDSSQCSSRPFAFSHLSAGFPMKMPLLVFEVGHFKPKLKLGVQFWRLVARLLFFLVKLWARLFPKPSMLEWKSSIWSTEVLLNFSWELLHQFRYASFQKPSADVYATNCPVCESVQKVPYRRCLTWIFCQPFDCWSCPQTFSCKLTYRNAFSKKLFCYPDSAWLYFLFASYQLLNHFEHSSISLFWRARLKLNSSRSSTAALSAMLCFSTHPTFKNCTVFWVGVLMHFLHLLKSRFLLSSTLRRTYKLIVLLVCRAYGRQRSFFFR